MAITKLPQTFYATYRASGSFSGVVGDCIEIIGSETAPVTVKVIEVASSVAQNLSIVKRSAADTGGTSAAATLVALDSRQEAASAVVKTYTVAPSAGAAVGTINTYKLGADQILVQTYTDQNAVPVKLRGAAQTLAVVIDAIGTIKWAVEFTEGEP